MTEALLVPRFDIGGIVRPGKRNNCRLLRSRGHSSITVGVFGERRFHDSVVNLLHNMFKSSEWKLVSVETVKTVCHVKVGAGACEVLSQFGSGKRLRTCDRGLQMI